MAAKQKAAKIQDCLEDGEGSLANVAAASITRLRLPGMHVLPMAAALWFVLVVAYLPSRLGVWIHFALRGQGTAIAFTTTILMLNNGRTTSLLGFITGKRQWLAGGAVVTVFRCIVYKRRFIKAFGLRHDRQLIYFIRRNGLLRIAANCRIVGLIRV